jgi:hypothetical protein
VKQIAVQFYSMGTALCCANDVICAAAANFQYHENPPYHVFFIIIHDGGDGKGRSGMIAKTAFFVIK